MKAERFALLLVIVLVIGVPLAVVLARSTPGTIEMHAQMADNGGWTPSDLKAQVGQPLHLRLTSDDVVHGFAVGQSPMPAIDVLPGQWTTTTLMFDQPGKYTFYCTRWCGPNHWRMRGTIEVTGEDTETIATTPPLYVTLNLDLDAPHLSDIVPDAKPSAARGAALDFNLDRLTPPDRVQSPAQLWRQLRSTDTTRALSDQQIWDLIALTYRTRTTPDRLAEGKQLYQQNCAACHGETGQGDGVIAPSLKRTLMPRMSMTGHETVAPIDFTDAKNMLGASDAILEGKIIRGGMGTGMPYWGPIFTTEQIQSLVDYLWMFQFDR
ncbi:Cytochrome c oxidase subunit 2 [Planctomycetaceae bacterium]|nr:Cytochrome c oxidase subunit 2 [Planctomycetaceae bacterium]